MKLLRVALVSLLFIIPSTLYAQTLGTSTAIPEGICNTGTAATDVLCANSLDHLLAMNPNNTGLQNLPKTYFLATQFTNNTVFYTTVTGLAFPVNMNTNYHASCHLIWQASVSTAGPKYQWTGPNGSTLTMFSSLISPFNFSSFWTTTATTYSTTIANTNTIGAVGTNFIDTLEFTLVNGTNQGTVQLTAAANGSGTLTLQAGSSCVVQ